jgi:hypothetical protein
MSGPALPKRPPIHPAIRLSHLDAMYNVSWSQAPPLAGAREGPWFFGRREQWTHCGGLRS